MTPRVLVLGAGLAGLGAAVALTRRGVAVEVLEAEARAGGLARSFEHDGYRLEIGPHFVRRSLAAEAGILADCVHVGAWEAIHRRGRLRPHPFGLLVEPDLVASVALARLRALGPRPPARCLGEHLRAAFGARFVAEVIGPLIEKWTGASIEELAVETAERLDPPQLGVLLHHLTIALTGRSRELGQDGGDYWVYPRAGITAVADGLIARHGLRVRCSTPAERIEVTAGRVRAVVAGGRELTADEVVTTLPPARLAALLGTTDRPPPLPTRGVVCVGYALRRPPVTRYHWTWFPAREVPFYRVSELTNAWPGAAPPGHTLLLAEVAFDEGDPTSAASDAELGERLWPALVEIYGLRDGDREALFVERARYAHPILREAERAAWSVPAALAANLTSAGRFGLHRHLLMHEAYVSGREAAARILARRSATGSSVSPPPKEP